MKIYEESQASSTCSSTAPEQSQQTQLLSFVPRKYSPNDSQQTRATDVLTSLVAESLLPFSIVESSAFKKFVIGLDTQFVVPSCKHLSTTLLTKKHKAIKEKVLDVLCHTESVSLTLDLWSNRQMQELHVTIY